VDFMNTMYRLWFVLALLGAAQARGQGDAKGIFIDAGSSPSKPATRVAVKYSVLLERNGETHTVPQGYRFIEGDHLKLQITSNRDAYIYVFHQTVPGDPESLSSHSGSKGIAVVNDSPCETLFPIGGGANNNLIRAKQVATIPGTTKSFELDDHPGIEKLVVVVSAKPTTVAKYCNAEDGRPAREGSPDNSSRSGSAQFNKELEEMSVNALQTPSKGIQIVDDYAAASNGEKPMAVTVDLKHYQKR
jgi:hypothetical protein